MRELRRRHSQRAVIKGLPRDAGGNYVIPGPVRDLALAFVELQEKRNIADYDRSERFRRSDVLILIEHAKRQVAKFSESAMSDDKKFLSRLPMGLERADKSLILNFRRILGRLLPLQKSAEFRMMRI